MILWAHTITPWLDLSAVVSNIRNYAVKKKRVGYECRTVSKNVTARLE